VQARSGLPDGEQTLLRRQVPGALKTECDERAAGDRDPSSFFERDEVLRQNALVDDPIDVPQRDAATAASAGFYNAADLISTGHIRCDQ
jgi:hypothetical protein